MRAEYRIFFLTVTLSAFIVLLRVLRHGADGGLGDGEFFLTSIIDQRASSHFPSDRAYVHGFGFVVLASAIGEITGLATFALLNIVFSYYAIVLLFIAGILVPRIFRPSGWSRGKVGSIIILILLGSGDFLHLMTVPQHNSLILILLVSLLYSITLPSSRPSHAGRGPLLTSLCIIALGSYHEPWTTLILFVLILIFLFYLVENGWKSKLVPPFYISILSGFLFLHFLVTSAYLPAGEFLSGTWRTLSSFLQNGGQLLAPDSYTYVQETWKSIYHYLFLTASTWFWLGVGGFLSLFALLKGLALPSNEVPLMAYFFVAAAFLVCAAAFMDFAGFPTGTLQLRVLPWAFLGAASLGGVWLAVHLGKSRFTIILIVAVLLLSAPFISVLKATHDPHFSNFQPDVGDDSKMAASWILDYSETDPGELSVRLETALNRILYADGDRSILLPTPEGDVSELELPRSNPFEDLVYQNGRHFLTFQA